MPLGTRAVRLTEQAYCRRQDLAAKSRQSLPPTLDKAIEAYRREQFLRDTAAAMTALHAGWDTTLDDGLDDE